MHYFGENGDRMHMMFNFQVNQSFFYALATAIPATVKAMDHRAKASDWAMGHIFAKSR